MRSTQRSHLSLLALLPLAACGGPAGVGGECDPGNADACESGLVCDVDECRRPLGATCDAGADKPECIRTAACVEDPEASDGGSICALTEGSSCEPGANEGGCAPGLRCAEVEDGSHVCGARVYLIGDVTSLTEGSAIAGAHVIALDERRAAVTDVAVTGASGAYEVEIPVLRTADGSPAAQPFTLRASAADYQTFPGGLRNALAIDAAEAELDDSDPPARWVIDNPQTSIGLIELPAASQGLAQVSGEVSAAGAAGVLVVAEDDASGEGFSAVTDLAGNFTIFNVPDGTYTVRGFKADLQLQTDTATVAGADVGGVELAASADPTATVDGGVQIVATTGLTTVVLVVESTFDEVYVRGDVAAGLRAPKFGPADVVTAFTITGVPDGDYVVLAGFENDELVRDESDIGGTDIVHLTVPDPTDGRTITLDSGFKVTGALIVVYPGAVDVGPEPVPDPATTTLTFEWEDSPGEETYELQILDAFGNEAWFTTRPKKTGAGNATLDYAGPALEAGMYYQFRVAALDNGGVVISRTEDLLGVFTIE